MKMKMKDTFLERSNEFLINNNHIRDKRNLKYKNISSFVITENKSKLKSIKINVNQYNSKENYLKICKITPNNKSNSNWNSLCNKYLNDSIKLKKSKNYNNSNKNLVPIKNIKIKKKLNDIKDNNKYYKIKDSQKNNISLEKIRKEKKNNKNRSTNIKINKINTSLFEDNLINKLKNDNYSHSKTKLEIKVNKLNEFKKSYEEDTNTSKKNKSSDIINNMKNNQNYDEFIKHYDLFHESERILNSIQLNNYFFPEINLIIQNRYKKKKVVNTLENFYELKNMIGKGNFGKVYLAKQILTNNDVAIKLISKAKIKNKDNKNKVELEIKLLRKSFGHNNIIKLYEYFENQEYIFLVFEYCPNGDILKYVKEKGIMNEILSMRIVYQILLGLKHLHEKNIFHRDIKLDNILLGNKMKCLIGDFGISLYKKEDDIITDTAGTPAYLAPEILKAKGRANFKSDIWSLGVLLYSITFGTMPFKAKNVQDVYQLILKGKFRFPENLKVSKELQDLIKFMLTYDIDKRPSVDDVLNHKWFKKEYLWDLSNNDKNFFDIKNLDNKKVILIKYIWNKVGFEYEYIENSLSKKVMNHWTSCFYVLYNKINY